MLPKRYDGRSAMNPGVMKLSIMPRLMPSVQVTAMAESSRTRPRPAIHLTPQAPATAKAMAVRMGLRPKYTPMPMPPNEAWVMPPLMNTRRRLTMYVPTSPQAMLASRLPSRAFCMNVYSSIMPAALPPLW